HPAGRHRRGGGDRVADSQEAGSALSPGRSAAGGRRGSFGVRGAGARRWTAWILAVGLLGSGCAYFNTFYSAKKSFDAAEKLYRNPDDRATSQQVALYDQALKSATKLVVSYPKSKYVDDAVLIMGRSLLGKGDYDKARQKFRELA